MLTALVITLLAAGDEAPRYQGGHPPTSLSAEPAREDSVSVMACTTETLKTSHSCVFDGRPGAASDVKSQAAANTSFAVQLGASLCRARTEPLGLDPNEKAAKARSCAAQVQRAAPACALDGKEGLVDGEGRFGSSAKACYLAIAEALQTMETPPAPPSRDDREPTGQLDPAPSKVRPVSGHKSGQKTSSL